VPESRHFAFNTRQMRFSTFLFYTFLFVNTSVVAQKWVGKFEQLGETLPTPNSYRTASGAPGPNYWQQRADYDIDVDLNDDTQVITGKETITYFNNSPETLRYLWLQLDQNNMTASSMNLQTNNSRLRDSIQAKNFPVKSVVFEYDGGFKIKSVKDAGSGKDLSHLINGTMMRVDVPNALKSGDRYAFTIEWSYKEKDRMNYNERSGYEYFPEDKNYIYHVAQWFPRMCVFDDYEGWQNKQFIDLGEFALAFGNYKVRITVPSDHIVGATGWLQNPKDVLTSEQIQRFEKAKTTFDNPVIIVTEQEARKKEKEHSAKKSTWEFHAENVRDFAFASSRKFIWDAMAVKNGTKTPLAQSLYPKEGNPVWEKESTRAIKNALDVYTERTIEYPYPTAYSVNWVGGGMEYPMVSFNSGRPGKDGKISVGKLTYLISVIVHEVGHNYFPMIVNSDERQWTWMDEGLNSFLEKETIRTRYPQLDFSDNTPQGITAFMKGDKSIMRPIMAQSDNQGRYFGGNGYNKPAAALTILRETVMGPELFDKAFKEYAHRWAFKHPKPADFFRTMEDASAVDLDWFWRGWFYTTDNVDVAVDDVKWFRVNSQKLDPEKKEVHVKSGDLSTKSGGKATDFSNGPQEFNVINTKDESYRDFQSRVNDNEVRQKLDGKNIYEVSFKNVGGLVTPLIIEWTYKDGSKEIEKIPAEIWRINETVATKVFVKEKEVVNIALDPNGELADVEIQNNVFPKRAVESKFDQFKKH
jgi:hypothetical protein